MIAENCCNRLNRKILHGYRYWPTILAQTLFIGKLFAEQRGNLLSDALLYRSSRDKKNNSRKMALEVVLMDPNGSGY
jgi:hypothetical protein